MKSFFLTIFMVFVFCLPAIAQTADQNIVIVFDDSGSMDARLRNTKQSRVEAAKGSLVSVVQAMPNQTNLGIYLLNEGWLIEVGPLDKNLTISKVQNIKASGGTPLGVSIKDAADALLKIREKQIYGLYKLIVVTDGEAGDIEKVESFVPDILARGITIDTIGLDIQGDHVLRNKATTFRDAADPNSITKELNAIVAENPDDNSNEEDLEFIQGLPSGLATNITKAFAENANHPIGTTPVIRSTEDGNSTIQYVPNDTQTDVSASFDTSDVFLIAGVVILFLVVLFFLLILWAES